MDCTPSTLLKSSACFQCVPGDSLRSIQTSLLCAWVNKPTGLPVIPDMLTWWKMEEGAGTTVFDSLSSGINGSFNPAAPNDPKWAPGKVGTWAVRFPNATNANIRNATAFDFTNQNFSFNLWILISTLAVDAVPIYKGYLSFAGYYARITTTGSVQFSTIQGGSAQISSTAVGKIAADALWHMLTFTRNGASVRIYVDNVDLTSVAAAHVDPLTSNQPFCLGIYNIITSNPLVGRVDDFMVFTRAITPAEVTILWNGGAGYP